MIFESSAQPGRRLRLGYCMNLHAASDFESLLQGMRDVSVPLSARLTSTQEFGVGMYLPAELAAALLEDESRAQLESLAEFLRERRLSPFTFNAFPYGGFQTDGLKAEVYRPTWVEQERVTYTLQVAECACFLATRLGLTRISISTHPGSFGAWLQPGDMEACADNMARVVERFVQIERETGVCFVLSLEAEPRASAGTSLELAQFRELANARILALLSADSDQGRASALLRRHFGTCLDTCHSAVAFEDAAEAMQLLQSAGGTLGKIQYSSALRLEDPGANPAGVATMLALDEPRFLHQVMGRSSGGGGQVLSVADLPELAALLAPQSVPDESKGSQASRAEWLACDEWRCHFHVPVDRDSMEVPLEGSAPNASPATRLGTTREHAAALLELALQSPDAFVDNELHVEIETYTWDVLPNAVRDTAALVDALEREYRSVLDLLARAGWKPAN
jgi:hypothetical protein